MHLSTLIFFTAFALQWASASPIDIYGQRSESALRPRNPTPASQAEIEYLQSQKNAYLSFIYRGYPPAGFRIYVTAFDGRPIRTYIVDADEKRYVAIEHSGRVITGDTIMHQNLPDGKQKTDVLMPNFNGLRTYTVNLGGKVIESHDPKANVITYSHEAYGKQIIRDIGPGGRPKRTTIKVSGRPDRVIVLTERSRSEAIY